MIIPFALHLAVFLSPGQTTDQVKALFSNALVNTDGAKLRASLSTEELNGATAQACTSFLELVTKPRISKMGTYDQSGRFLCILDQRSPMTIQFRATGGANILITERRTLIFDPATIATRNGVKATTGFADIAFWAAHEDESVKAKRGTLNRAIAAHELFEKWVIQFTKMGIKGSIDPESKKYMTWSQIVDSSIQEINRMKKGVR